MAKSDDHRIFIIYSGLTITYYYEKSVIDIENIKLTESSREKCFQKRRIPRFIVLRIIFTEITKSTELP